MSDPQSVDVSSMVNDGGNSDSAVEVNVKTLDSQLFSFQVDKNMLVSQFKQKIASEVGLPVGQQRLIFRGKVLKDDHALSEYHVDRGHTLHLVARQPSESLPHPSTSYGEASSNNGSIGQDLDATGLPTGMAHISHSVVLGSLNVGDQGEGVGPDISQVIGAVLNSIGIGSQAATNSIGVANVMRGPQPSVQVLVPQGNEMEGAQNINRTRGQAGTRAQPGWMFPSQSLPQVLQIPVGASLQIPMGAAIPVPSLNAPIPDSLHTLSEFMSRMELALSHNGVQPNESQTNNEGRPALDLPLDTRGLPTPEALMIVLRQAQHLLGDHVVSALSHIAGRLEQDEDSADTNVRGQMQTESVELGITMQQLGSLFLEIGRTILTLRMGQSPAEASVNVGPAVYISSSGPNPIMVQPFPFQNNSLFGGSAAPNSGHLGRVGNGSAARHVNIHIHTAVSPRAASTVNGAQGGHGNRTNSGNFGQIQLPPESAQMPTVVAEVGSRLGNHIGNMLSENQASSDGQSDSSAIQNPPCGSGFVDDETGNQMMNLADSGAQELNSSVLGDKADTRGRKVSPEGLQNNDHEISLVNSRDATPSSSGGGCDEPRNGETALRLVSDSECVPVPGQGSDGAEHGTAVPLGLGLGGLQPKRKSRQPRLQDKAGDGTPNVSDQNLQTVTSGQHVLQSLAPTMNSRNTYNIPSIVQPPAGLGPMMEGGHMIGQGDDGQIDVRNAMSEVLHSPALSGLLSGISQQTGVGSPDVLRNMLEQFTHSPAMGNMFNQMAQQFGSQDVGNMFSGIGRGQGGGLDLAGMVQQMMPMVSEALGGGLAPLQQPLSSVVPDLQPHFNARGSGRDEIVNHQGSQIDLQLVLQRIENQNPPEEIFHSLVMAAARSYDSGSGGDEDLVNEICHEEGLASEFMEVLRHDICEQIEAEKGSPD